MSLTTRQARKLRPIAIERARHSKFRAGDVVYFGGIGWYPVKIGAVLDLHPYRAFLVTSVRSGRGDFYVTGRGLFTDQQQCSEYGGVATVPTP